MFKTTKIFNDNAAVLQQGFTHGAEHGHHHRPVAPKADTKNDKTANANNRDAMVATMLLDCLFGGALNNAVDSVMDVPADMQGFDYVTTAELADEYWTTRQNDATLQKNRQNRTNGLREGVHYDLDERNVLRGGFNMSSSGSKGRTIDLGAMSLPSVGAIVSSFSAKTSGPSFAMA